MGARARLRVLVEPRFVRVVGFFCFFERGDFRALGCRLRVCSGDTATAGPADSADTVPTGATGINTSHADLIGAIRHGSPIRAPAIPGPGPGRAAKLHGFLVNDAIAAAPDGDQRCLRSASGRQPEGPGTALQRDLLGLNFHLLADQRRGGGQLGRLFQAQQALQVLVHGDLLFYRGELHQLIGHLVSIQRIGRALVLDLRGQQRQEGIEIPPEFRTLRGAGGGIGGSGGNGCGHGLGSVQTAMSIREVALRVGPGSTGMARSPSKPLTIMEARWPLSWAEPWCCWRP